MRWTMVGAGALLALRAVNENGPGSGDRQIREGDVQCSFEARRQDPVPLQY